MRWPFRRRGNTPPPPAEKPVRRLPVVAADGWQGVAPLRPITQTAPPLVAAPLLTPPPVSGTHPLLGPPPVPSSPSLPPPEVLASLPSTTSGASEVGGGWLSEVPAARRRLPTASGARPAAGLTTATDDNVTWIADDQDGGGVAGSGADPAPGSGPIPAGEPGESTDAGAVGGEGIGVGEIGVGGGAGGGEPDEDEALGWSGAFDLAALARAAGLPSAEVIVTRPNRPSTGSVVTPAGVLSSTPDDIRRARLAAGRTARVSEPPVRRSDSEPPPPPPAVLPAPARPPARSG